MKIQFQNKIFSNLPKFAWFSFTKKFSLRKIFFENFIRFKNNIIFCQTYYSTRVQCSSLVLGFLVKIETPFGSIYEVPCSGTSLKIICGSWPNLFRQPSVFFQKLSQSACDALVFLFVVCVCACVFFLGWFRFLSPIWTAIAQHNLPYSDPIVCLHIPTPKIYIRQGKAKQTK